jgi:hypothetical protein
MSVIGKWKNHEFVVSPDKIESFRDLQIKGGSNLEEKKKGNKPTVKRKGAKPLELSMTVELNAFVGSDVKKNALTLVKEAVNGDKGYFYIGGKKLMTCKLMLTDATLKNPDFTADGNWIKAQVTLTMKQSTKGNVNVSGGGKKGKKKKKKKGKGSKKTSVRASSPVTTPSGGGTNTASRGTQTTTTNQLRKISDDKPSRSATKSANMDAKTYMNNGKNASSTQLSSLRRTG